MPNRLETIILPFLNPKTQKWVKIRAFLDSGSNLTAMSEESADRCGLNATSSETILLATFQNKARRQTFRKTTLNLYKNDDNFSGNISLQPFIMKKIIDPLKTYPISERQVKYFKENNIELADPDILSSGKLNIDLLIGQDFLYHFHCSAPSFVPGGSFLIKTWNNKHIFAGPVDPEAARGAVLYPCYSPRFLLINHCLNNRKTFQDLGYTRRVSDLFKGTYSTIRVEDELDVLEQFRSLELLGISPLDFSVSPLLEEFNNTTRLVNGAYVVKLPTKEPQIKHLSNNFFQAFTRLMSGIKKRMKPKFSEEAEKYRKSFEEEIERGVLERVEDLGTIEEVCKIIKGDPYFFNKQKSADGNPRCYLPHHCVYKMSNGKFRRVHDAKAKPGKHFYSLNDCLNKGPNLIATILHVLLGFRKNKFGYAADIEKAFPTVVIEESHRDLLRCLWVEEGRVIVYRFARLPFGLSCSPFLLQATLRKHLGDNCVSEELMTQFTGAVYMDDLVSSEETAEELRSKKEYITSLFGECGMIFRDWNSNERATQQKFAEQEGKEVSELFEQLILGIKWDTREDSLRVSADRLIDKIKSEMKTKRDMWKIIPSLFDPLGLLSPYCLLGKKIVMDACKEVKNWDSKMPQKYVDRLLNWAQEFDKIESIKFPRFAGVDKSVKLELYGCCDASSYAMGGCIYLVSTDQHGKKHSQLVLGKTRNKPSSEHSIARLELISAVLLVNMMSHVQKVYGIDSENIHYFSDSSIVLHWLYSGDMSWKPFVANQIKKIKKGSFIENWHHISGTENPADLASRGETLENLARSLLWRNGPNFWLSGNLDNGNSPVEGLDKHYKSQILEECYKELSHSMKKDLDRGFGINKKGGTGQNKKNIESKIELNNVSSKKNIHSIQALSFVANVSDPQATSGIHNIVDINKIKNHDYDKLMATTNIWISFARYFIDQKYLPKLKEKNKTIPEKLKEKLSFMDPNTGPELLWLQSIQKRYFKEIFILLNKPKAKVSPASRSLLRSHAIFLDKEMNLLRCTTRNERSSLSYSTVYPILLPSLVKIDVGFEDCMFTKMLVINRHRKLAHLGTPNVLSNLRSEFWITRGRAFVHRIIKKCVVCRKQDGVTYSRPPEPPLPEFRVTREKPFDCTGVDFAGPFKCKDTPKGKNFKAWFLTFSCGNTRAVHVEAVRSRKLGDFVLALSRFIDANGIPSAFISDHEKAFKKSAECLQQIAKSTRVQNFLQSRRISWNFYTERAPQKGGFIERMNGPIKKAFYKSVGTQVTNFEEFRSLATHVTSVLNDRPITYLMSDIEASETPLSPSMLLRGYNLNEPLGLNLRKMKDPKETKLGEQYYLSERLKNTFWRLWNKQYLTELFERHVRNKKAQKAQVVPKLGEVVLMVEEKIPRRSWRLAKVVGIREGRNQEIRQVTVQTLSPKKNLITKLNRTPEKLVPVLSEPLQVSPEKLVPLECGNEKVKILPKSKYSKNEVKTFKRKKILPPYKPSPQFLNPEVLNQGPEKDIVNKETEIELELPRTWS